MRLTRQVDRKKNNPGRTPAPVMPEASDRPGPGLLVPRAVAREEMDREAA
jgi:hypothetical protein